MGQKYTDDTMLWYYKDLDENLALLIQKTEGKKAGGSNYRYQQTNHNFLLRFSPNFFDIVCW